MENSTVAASSTSSLGDASDVRRLPAGTTLCAYLGAGDKSMTNTIGNILAALNANAAGNLANEPSTTGKPSGGAKGSNPPQGW